MSSTMIDERFLANENRASAIANKAALILIITVVLLSMSAFRVNNPNVMLKILIAVIGFAFGLSMFLQQYLLYRFENGE